jgi:hypothetical protein
MMSPPKRNLGFLMPLNRMTNTADYRTKVTMLFVIESAKAIGTTIPMVMIVLQAATKRGKVIRLPKCSATATAGI